MKKSIFNLAFLTFFLFVFSLGSSYGQKGGGNYGAVRAAQSINASNSIAIAIPQSIKSNSREITTHQGKIKGTRNKYKIRLDSNNKIASLDLYDKKGRPNNAKVIFVICGKSNKSLEMNIGNGTGTYYVNFCQNAAPRIEFIP